jgi:MFS family permease
VLLVFATGLTIGSECAVVPVLGRDVLGVESLFVVGMVLTAAGVLGMVLVRGYLPWVAPSGLSGLGMTLLYPNLTTVPSDAAHPTWRATGMGVYRM